MLAFWSMTTADLLMSITIAEARFAAWVRRAQGDLLYPSVLADRLGGRFEVLATIEAKSINYDRRNRH